MYIRGGSGVIFNNTLSGEFYEPIHLTNYRSWATPGGEPSGECLIDDYDPYYCSYDYPCIDQIKNLYIWNNNYNSSTLQAVVDDRGYNKTHIQENQDYFHTQKLDYTSYTYPHPLVSGE